MRTRLLFITLVIACIPVSSAFAESNPLPISGALEEVEPLPYLPDAMVPLSLDPLLGGVPFGGTMDQLATFVEGRFDAAVEFFSAAMQSQAEKHLLAKEYAAKLKTFVKSLVAFDGTPSPYDVSPLSGNYCNRGGSALQIFEDGPERLYFIYEGGKLYRVVLTSDSTETTQGLADAYTSLQTEMGLSVGKPPVESMQGDTPLVAVGTRAWEFGNLRVTVRDPNGGLEPGMVVWTYMPLETPDIVACCTTLQGGKASAEAEDLLDMIKPDGPDTADDEDADANIVDLIINAPTNTASVPAKQDNKPFEPEK